MRQNAGVHLLTFAAWGGGEGAECRIRPMNPASGEKKGRKPQAVLKVLKVPAELLRWDRRESRYIRCLSLECVCVSVQGSKSTMCVREKERGSMSRSLVVKGIVPPKLKFHLFVTMCTEALVTFSFLIRKTVSQRKRIPSNKIKKSIVAMSAYSQYSVFQVSGRLSCPISIETAMCFLPKISSVFTMGAVFMLAPVSMASSRRM